MIIWFLFFNLMWYITLIADIEKSLHPWDKSHLIMVFNLLNVLLDLVCYNLLRIFVCIFISDLCFHTADLNLSGFLHRGSPNL